MSQQRAAPLEHAVDLAEPGDAGIGFDENDGVIGECRDAERGSGGRRRSCACAGTDTGTQRTLVIFIGNAQLTKCSELSNT